METERADPIGSPFAERPILIKRSAASDSSPHPHWIGHPPA
jgi:hypothetical protein